jgi:hypothetical protein
MHDVRDSTRLTLLPLPRQLWNVESPSGEPLLNEPQDSEVRPRGMIIWYLFFGGALVGIGEERKLSVRGFLDAG